LRFKGTVYRAHDPRWAFSPLSGAGAAINGGRFNAKGIAALYSSLAVETLFKEVAQGLPRKLDPLTICSYEVDCDDIADLTTEAGRAEHAVTLADLACPWKLFEGTGKPVPSRMVAQRLMTEGLAGILVPSFAIGATGSDVNLVLWTWSNSVPHKITLYDPEGRLTTTPGTGSKD
jgi:RES domain-containing protein